MFYCQYTDKGGYILKKGLIGLLSVGFMLCFSLPAWAGSPKELTVVYSGNLKGQVKPVFG